MIIAENPAYLLGIYNKIESPSLSHTLDYYNLYHNKETLRAIRKLIKKAFELGWFDGMGSSE
jgi:hypothetical protein